MFAINKHTEHTAKCDAKYVCNTLLNLLKDKEVRGHNRYGNLPASRDFRKQQSPCRLDCVVGMWSFVFPHISGETILTLAVGLLCCQPPMQPGFPVCTFKRPVKSLIARPHVRRKFHETLECAVFPAKLAVPTPHHSCCVCLSSFILSLSQCVETFPSLLWGVTVFPKDNCDSRAARGAALSVRMKTNISQP